jgi:hypothetical protein
MNEDFYEHRIDITDEIATWHVRDLIKLLDVLEKNGYRKTYFDGYDAAFYVVCAQPRCPHCKEETVIENEGSQWCKKCGWRGWVAKGNIKVKT